MDFSQDFPVRGLAIAPDHQTVKLDKLLPRFGDVVNVILWGIVLNLRIENCTF